MKPYELSVLINGELAFTTSASRLRVLKRVKRWVKRNDEYIDKMPDDTLIEIVYRYITEIKVERFTKGEL